MFYAIRAVNIEPAYLRGKVLCKYVADECYFIVSYKQDTNQFLSSSLKA